MSKAEFGRRVGRGRSTITEACQGALTAACLHSGRLDVSHAAVAEWCVARGIDPDVLRDVVASRPARARAEPQLDRTRPKPDPAPSDATHARSLPLDGLLDLTLRQITDRFGSQQGFADFLDQRKKLADTLARELQIDRDRGLLVPRAFIETHVIGLIDGTNRRLLTDVPRSLCRELFSLAKSGAPVEEAESTTRKLIEKQIGGEKTRVLRAIAKSSKNTQKPGVTATPSEEERSPERDDTHR